MPLVHRPYSLPGVQRAHSAATECCASVCIADRARTSYSRT